MSGTNQRDNIDSWFAKFSRKVLCDWLGQHNGKGELAHWFDGASFHAVCGRCGRNVMQDSQGNWFTFDNAEYRRLKQAERESVRFTTDEAHTILWAIHDSCRRHWTCHLSTKTADGFPAPCPSQSICKQLKRIAKGGEMIWQRRLKAIERGKA